MGPPEKGLAKEMHKVPEEKHKGPKHWARAPSAGDCERVRRADVSNPEGSLIEKSYGRTRILVVRPGSQNPGEVD